MANIHEQMIKPGAGLSMEHIQLSPIKNALCAGEYIIDETAHKAVDYAYANMQTITSREKNAILGMTNNKGFRNAYASIITERAYLPYTGLVTGDNMGFYAIEFDD